MTAPLIDTDMLSEVMKQRDPKVTARMQAYLLAHNSAHYSVVTHYEILKGLYHKQATGQLPRYLTFAKYSTIFPVTQAVAETAAQINGPLLRTGKALNDADMLIAATAMTLGSGVVTGNTDHFNRVSGLQLENWRE